MAAAGFEGGRWVSNGSTSACATRSRSPSGIPPTVSHHGVLPHFARTLRLPSRRSPRGDLGEAVRERLSVPVPQPELVVLGVKEGEAVGVGLPEGHREEEGE